MRILAVDPGLQSTGWCIFLDGELTRCGYTTPSKGSTWERVNHIIEQVPTSTYDVFVGEVPNYNDRRAKRSDPNLLTPMVMITSGIRARCSASKTYLPLPSEWKGNVPKIIHNQRLVAQLDEYAVHLVEKDGDDRHDVWDAVGLALWAMKMENYDAKR